MTGFAKMPKRKTYFEQVPLDMVHNIAGEGRQKKSQHIVMAKTSSRKRTAFKAAPLLAKREGRHGKP
jgi:hypothetical protein